MPTSPTFDSTNWDDWTEIQCLIDWIDRQYSQNPATTYDRPDNWNSLFENHSFFPTAKSTRTFTLLQGKLTFGSLVVGDHLIAQKPIPSRHQESVNIVAAQYGQNPAIVKLVIEVVPYGPDGAVVPDLHRLCQVLDPGTLANFQDTMTRTIQKAQHANSRSLIAGHFRWWLEKHAAFELPDRLDGRSAEAAVACCMWALLKNEPQTLLNDRVLVSATVEWNDQKSFEETPIGEVDSLTEKHEAANQAKLTAFFLHENHKNEFPDFDANDTASTCIVQFPRTLGEVYDKLCINSIPVVEFKDKVKKDWQSRWDPQDTRPEYRQRMKSRE